MFIPTKNRKEYLLLRFILPYLKFQSKVKSMSVSYSLILHLQEIRGYSGKGKILQIENRSEVAGAEGRVGESVRRVLTNLQL